MIERFFLDRVDTKSSTASVGIENHLSIAVFADEAETFIAWVEVAMAWAELAKNFIGGRIFESRPPLSSNGAVVELRSSHIRKHTG